ncbi:metallophosphoesterase [Nitrospirillum sp. BR 11752]|uniref:metallophosphoesterase n=1 Tax=Nitrospirillum sp. BR 11752 TaxID=3104293 RepID=UPI002EBCE3EB|nr:metallophosphoesterase [Nitrospirillum sp. BR 11752]
MTDRKIRLAVMSDLHNEFEAAQGSRRPTAASLALDEGRRRIPGHPTMGPLLDGLIGDQIDLVILAGDINVGVRGIEYAREVAQLIGAKTVYVMGNHEAYNGRDLDLLAEEFRNAADATKGSVTFLENQVAVFDFDGQRLHVLGCTLWTDYAMNGSDSDEIAHSMERAGDSLNDHVRISVNGQPFTPYLARQRHLVSRAWLAEEVKRIRAEGGEDAKILIVTHHAPVRGASGPQYVGDPLSPAFASDLTQEIISWRPVAWIFGHTHFNLDTQIGGTRVVAAQRGYLGYEPGSEEFRPKVIEV